MMWLLSKLELPLFFRELIELSAKKRTYLTRVLYAVVLFSVGFSALGRQLLDASKVSSSLQMMGSGNDLFRALFQFQMLAIHLITPALVCSAITLEKERNTLGILLLTNLGPWRILFEKLCSRLLPMVTCLLLSVPILALSYSLGGLNTNSLINGVLLLGLSCLQVGTLTLMCSSFFRTMPSAFIASYVLQALVAFVSLFIGRGRWGMFSDAFSSVSGYGLWANYGAEDPLALFSVAITLISVGFVVVSVARLAYVFLSPFRGSRLKAVLQLIFSVAWLALWGVAYLMFVQARSVQPQWGATWIVAMSLGFFVMARVFLVSRSQAKSKSRLMALFKLLDRFFVWSNQLTGGITLVNDISSLPGDEPIAWREVTKKSLGTARYLFRIFLVIEIPTAAICLLATGAGFYGEGTRLGGLTLTLWSIIGLIVAIRSASLVASERSSETLDALLTTPLSTRAIIQQKCAGLRRMLVVTSIPLITVACFSAYMKGFPNSLAIYYAVWAFGNIFVLLQLISWSSVWIGMGMSTQTRSSFAAMSLLIFVVALPAIVTWAVEFAVPSVLYQSDYNRHGFKTFLLIIGPFYGLWENEYGGSYFGFSDVPPVSLVLTHLVAQAILTFVIRRRVFSIAARQLGRADGSQHQVSPAVVVSSPDSPEQFEPSHAVS